MLPPLHGPAHADLLDRELAHEKASDVFEAVSAGAITATGTGADQPTLVVAGPETGVFPGQSPNPAPVAEPTGIRKYRAPRKPR